LPGMGISKHFSRLLASDRISASQSAILQIAWALRLTISAMLLVFLPVLCLIVPAFLFPVDLPDVNTVRWLVVLAAVEYLLAGPTEMMQVLCIANEKIDLYSKFTVISGLYRYALMFLGILAFGTPLMTVALIVSRRIIDPWVAHRIMKGYPGIAWRPRFDLAAFRDFLGSSALLSLSQLVHLGMLSLGSVLANTFCGLAGLGLYRAAFDLASRLWVISNGLGLVVFPRFACLLAVDDDNPSPALGRMSGILDASWAGYLALCTFGAWVAPHVLPLIGFQPDAIQLFMLLLLGTGMNAHGNLSHEFLLAGGKYLWATLILVAGSATLAVVFLGLHHQMGILTLGWAWIASQFIYATMVDIGAGTLAGDSAATIGWQAATKILVASAAVAATAISLTSPVSTAILAPAFVCLLALAIALQGLRTPRHPLCEGQQA